MVVDSVMYRLTKSFKKSLSPEKFHHFIQCFDSFCELESSNAVKGLLYLGLWIHTVLPLSLQS